MAEKIDCVIVSGAPVDDTEFIKENIPANAYIIAADSGYKKLESIGLKPDLIIADFDSSDEPEGDYNIKSFPVEKDATDTFNAVKAAVSKGFKNLLILGALGGRLDHTYSNILCLDYAMKNGADCVIADSNNRLSLIKKKRSFNKDYQWFSLFAFMKPCYGIKIEGAHYTAGFYGKDRLDLEPFEQYGQSNYIENDKCTVSVEKGVLLLIECNDYR
ncbi:MAG: thiamine diphosphokinase [Eubacterium sp.]|nr:thiamine diphosphokinase [Eubacterium sp.]